MRVTIVEWFKVQLKGVESQLDLDQTAPLFAFKAAMGAKFGVRHRFSSEEWGRRYHLHRFGEASPVHPPAQMTAQMPAQMPDPTPVQNPVQTQVETQAPEPLPQPAEEVTVTAPQGAEAAVDAAGEVQQPQTGVIQE